MCVLGCVFREFMILLPACSVFRCLEDSPWLVLGRLVHRRTRFKFLSLDVCRLLIFNNETDRAAI